MGHEPYARDWEALSAEILSGMREWRLNKLVLATPEAMLVLEAAGKDILNIETVGVGQSEVEITDACDTTLVVLNPGWGDAVQAAKAGIMEIADVFVIK